MEDLRRDGTAKGSTVVAASPEKPDDSAARAEKAMLLAIQDGVILRPYHPEDRAEAERICQLTGLRGELDELFCDRPLFVKLWLSPYLDGAPEDCLIAEQGGKVVGYLVGSTQKNFHFRAARHLLPHVLTLLWRWMTGHYRHHPPSGRFVRWLLTRAWWELPKTPENSANFHFNLDPELVSTLVGERLIAKFEERIEAAGLSGWHAILFSSPNKRPVSLYRRIGFTIVDQKQNTLFPTGDVQTVCIYKPLHIWIHMARVPMKGKPSLRNEKGAEEETE